MHLASGADARYLPHLATLIESLAVSNEGVTVHALVDATVTDGMRETLRARADAVGVRVEFASAPEDAPAALPVGPFEGRFPRLIWDRIWLPQLLPSLERVLYLDADTLVLQDLRALWETDLGDHLLAAVHHGPPDGDHRLAAIGRRLPEDYFNSGVLLMNLPRMRDEGLSERLVEIGLELAERTDFPDQDAYNLACEGRWLALHPRWNVFASLYLPGSPAADAAGHPRLAEAAASPAILHFEGSAYAKPWSHRCVHPHRELYRAYRARTPWPLRELADSGRQDRLLARLPVRHQLALSRLQQRLRRARRGVR